MKYYLREKDSEERREIDAFAFSSEIGKYADRVGGPGADEPTVMAIFLRAQEQAAEEDGLNCGNCTLYMCE